MLLLRAAQYLAFEVSRESVSQNLFHVRVCLEVLGFCEEQDIVAMRLLDLLVPAYQCLRQIIDNPAIAAKMDSTPSHSEVNNGSLIPGPLAHVVHQLVAATATRYQELWV